MLKATTKSEKLSTVSLLTFAGRLLYALAFFVVTILFSHYLPVKENGSYQAVWIGILFFQALATLGINNTLLAFKTNELIDLWHWFRSKIHRYLLAVFLLSFVFLLSLQYTEHLPLPFHLYWLVFILGVLANILEGLLLRFKLLLSNSWINALFSICFIGVHVCFLCFSWNWTTLFYAILIGYFLKCALSYVVLRPKFFIKDKSAPFVDFGIGKLFINQWQKLGLSELVQVLYAWFDKWIISILATATLTAVYLNGAKEIPIFPMLLSAISSGVLIKLHDEDSVNTDTVLERLKDGSKFLAHFILPIFLFLLIYANDFIKLLFSSKYEDSIPIFRLAICLLPIRLYAFSTFFQFYKRADIILKGVTIELGLLIVLFAILFPNWSIIGGSIAVLISTYFLGLYYLLSIVKITNRRLIDILPLKYWGKVLVESIALVLLILILNQFVIKDFLWLFIVFFVVLGLRIAWKIKFNK